MSVTSAGSRTRDGRPEGLDAALSATREVIGADRVTLAPADGGQGAAESPLGPNVSLFRHRRVHALLRPRTAQEVRRIVEIFGGTPSACPLHPFSTGRNWGLGTREPAGDGVVALDLGGLDQVRDLDVSAGWAVVEPGVSQGRLAQMLAGTDRMLNVTSSAAASGVIGNALDRGVGMRHQRTEDLLGLELVMPDGELVRVGWWPDGTRATPVYSHGLGPSLVQFFVQSDMAVVTAAAVRLLPRPEALRLVRLNFAPDKLPDAVTVLRRWSAQGLARGVLKVYNPPAARAYRGAEGQFLAHVCVDGTAESVEAISALVVAEAERSGLFTDVSRTDAQDPERPDHEVARLVERSYAGDPDGRDALFQAKMGRPADTVDEQVGFLFFLPLVPFDGPSVARADQLLDVVATRTGVRCGATLHGLSPDLIDYVVTMKFARDGEAPQRAHRALDLLHELFTDAGFVPYRLDVDHADWAHRLTPDPRERALARRLKHTLDPRSVIAAGRYF
jgi:4-cresol dehydrogenase (hydroxylating) flavoprotein subunit